MKLFQLEKPLKSIYHYLCEIEELKMCHMKLDFEIYLNRSIQNIKLVNTFVFREN